MKGVLAGGSQRESIKGPKREIKTIESIIEGEGAAQALKIEIAERKIKGGGKKEGDTDLDRDHLRKKEAEKTRILADLVMNRLMVETKRMSCTRRKRGRRSLRLRK